MGSTMDDLDNLLADLGGTAKPAAKPAPAPAKASPQAAPAKKQDMSDLDALMSDLTAPPAKAAAKPAPAPAPAKATSDLDALMSDLTATPAAKPVAKAAPAPAPAKASPAATPGSHNTTASLDALMADLTGPPKPTAKSSAAAQANTSSTASLDALMADLTSPAPGQKAQAKAAPAPAPAAKPAAAGGDLDALMADLQKPAPAAAKATPAAAPAKAPAKAAPAANDLDALMADLSGPKPAAQPAQPAAKPAVAAKPAAAAKPVTNDLDNLLADLQGSGSPAAAPRPAAAPAKAAPAPAAAPAVNPNLQNAGDLDSVMRALSGLGPAPQAKPKANAGQSLDSILSNLTTDMTAMGVQNDYKGTCAGCMKPIIGQVVTALGKSWHVEHFACGKCKTPLGSGNFFERDGFPYCETCYHDNFSARCAYCNGVITDRLINALGMTWHPDHFFCNHCGRPFNDGGFMEKDQKPYCEECFFQNFAPKCAKQGCDRPVMGECITAMGGQWHPECFTCTKCNKDFGGGSFFEHEGKPYCEVDFHLAMGSLCSGCHRPITGRCVTAMNKRYHPEHFICCFCQKSLSKGTFKEQNEKPYCLACHIKLYG